jgi:hypothetical protein
LAVIVVSAYVLKFGGNFSDDPERWGAFGDYVGGILNPIFAFLAFVALLLTIILQSRELELTRVELGNSAKALQDSRDIAARQRDLMEAQAQKEDVFRIITYIFDQIKQISDDKYTLYLKNSNCDRIHESINYFFGTKKKENVYKYLPNGMEENNENWISNNKNLSSYVERLHELISYLKMFEELSGNRTLTNYYKRRIQDVAWDMYQKNYIDVNLFDSLKVT